MTVENNPPDLGNLKKRVVTIEDIERKVAQYMFIKDQTAIIFCAASFLANYLPEENDPTWIQIIAESSGGKTELHDLFTRLQDTDANLAYKLSDLTSQTFASGSINTTTETSLLYKINGKVLLFKDFTTILQKNKDSQKEILSQMREMFDGEFNKTYGTGKSIKWKGRVGCIVCLTPPAAEMLSAHAAMGERFIAYYLKQPTDSELAKALASNEGKNIKKLKEEAALLMKEFIMNMVKVIETTPVENYRLPKELVEEINLISQFATRARSPVAVDFRTAEPISVPSIERFPRFAKQLTRIAKVYVIMNGGRPLTSLQKESLYKVAFDSIPRTRKAVFYVVASHRTVSTSVVAARLGFTSTVVRGYLSQLSSLGLVMRIPKGAKGNEDAWKLVPVYEKTVEVYGHIKMEQKDLFEEDDVEPDDFSYSDEKELAELRLERQKIRDEAEIQAIQLAYKTRFNIDLTWEEAKEKWTAGEEEEDIF